jgi:hypothetical protein
MIMALARGDPIAEVAKAISILDTGRYEPKDCDVEAHEEALHLRDTMR